MTKIGPGGGDMMEKEQGMGKGRKVAMALLILSAMVEPGGTNRAPRCVLLGLGKFFVC